MALRSWWARTIRTLCVVLALARLGYGQVSSLPPSGLPPSGTLPGGIIVQVFTDQHALLTDQALVRLRNTFTGSDQWLVTTRYRSEAVFDDILPGSYEIIVSAAGYATVAQSFVMQSSLAMERVTVILQRDGSIPEVSTPPSSGVPEDVRKDTQRGFEALRAGELQKSEKSLRKAHKRYPDNADLNYLLGVLYVLKNELGEAKQYLGKAVAADAKHVRALTTLGRVLLQQNDATGAISYLEKAVVIDPEQWMPHLLLSHGYLRTAQYDKADQSAQSAMRLGKGAADVAHLSRGHALANLGRLPEAIEELEAFARNVPANPAVSEVRQTIAQLRAAVAEGRTSPPAALARTPAAPNPPVAGAPEAALAVPVWGPPGVDDVKPLVARGVACPDKRVIDGTSERLKEFISSIARFEATEDVVHEELDEVGNALTRETRKFSYLADISEPRPNVPRVEEDRRAIAGPEKFPAGISTMGLPALAFVFHPKSRDNYELVCEGLGQWQNQATWLVHFRQRENRPSNLLGYGVDHGFEPVDLKGRAWIAADTFQIVRIEAEAIRPMPSIKLLTLHQIVDYGRVTFSSKHVELLLPKKAELFFLFRGHRYRREHRFSNFRLFSVDSNDKVVGPKVDSPR